MNVSELKNRKFESNTQSRFGVGGIATKVKASTIAARGGISTFIANGFVDQVLLKIIEGQKIGTLIYADLPVKNAKKLWLSNNIRPCGKLVLDSGAVKAIEKLGKSLLPIGVLHVVGNFDRGDVVVCLGEDGRELAQGLINYSADECSKIKGYSTREIESQLGFMQEKELIHRDNLSLISSSSRSLNKRGASSAKALK